MCDCKFFHRPVLVDEVMNALNVHEGQIVIDGTLGGGGHTDQFLKSGASVFASDRDPDAIQYCKNRFIAYNQRLNIFHTNFTNLVSILMSQNIYSVDAILLDLGISSYQLFNATRGFSFQSDGPLDMRMSREGITVADLINTLSAEELAMIFYQYGDEHRALKLAKSIVYARNRTPFKTTLQLSNFLANFLKKKNGRHPATRIFQALRIAINDELTSLSSALPHLINFLKPGGKMAVITFHSLEDRIVKHFFRKHAQAEIDHPTWVAPRPNPEYYLKLYPSVIPSRLEIEENHSARSARLRVVERIMKQ